MGEEVEDDGLEDYWLWETQTLFGRHRNATGNLTLDACADFPTQHLKRVQVVLKVGAADDAARTEAQLNSVIKCISNVLIVSDDDHAYGPYQAHDVLASLPPDSYMNPGDYAVYNKQKNSSHEELVQGHDGWKIDKYKFLPEIEQAREVAPQAEWYVFLESDTYIFWDNLFRLLGQYNSSLPWYMGSPSPGKEYKDKRDGHKKKVWFANGGPGFVLSSAAAEALVHLERNKIGMQSPRITDQYKRQIREDCCGDSILGWALHDKPDVHITGLWPMFTPHPLHDIPFGQKYWCEPVISLHKTATEDFVPLWEWEQSRDRTKGPLLYSHLLPHLLPSPSDTRENWDAAYQSGYNYRSPHAAHDSLASCADACAADADCWQYTYHAAHCWMSRDLFRGHAKQPDGAHDEEGRKYVSGWDEVKIANWTRGNECEEQGRWVKGSTVRIF
ncbi:hypothetical protein EJ04DRAFT_431676 [Polyplosphaeria fusca]|uniref:N-acetylgalactosaminide beta-1,3-galactosyltransferase n=1 Tax=Polyplosphaeria fusca TaxID=682080 RepID=A0A9P4V238_9PLEO|nr:hypothetical protein EJ04DRAFT_431676 [Polyplosphaeria fusca]